ncbi:hypothetical protein OR571_12630 [Psychrobacillus sp. NEAU-3TGS]|uniref:hypothetical protein n=1 Tax=Psychrobacillus sp. NEAU-3TGS TaxID=2995412 RepID=UPI0024990687|nr:hypothetical protein [Psychrobacillus sp. NEAU-3TGS]MDI2587939.1 hypothetical protein [Psychrobacillus sp. NEAU-3TGS]
MGIFFEKVERKKSTKPIFTIRILLNIVMVICLILAFANELDIFYFRIVILLAGVGSLIEGIESYLRKEDRKVYLGEFSFTAILFLFAFTLWNME